MVKYSRKAYKEQDFLRIRDFLKRSFQQAPSQRNWLIDRWNFCRYMGQIMHDTYSTWPDTVGIWEDEGGEIVAVVHSQGDKINRRAGQAFFQLADREFSDDFMNELINYAEGELPLTTAEGTLLHFRVNEDAHQIKNLLSKRGYALQEWKEPMSCMDIAGEFKVELPEGFKIVDGKEVSDYQKGFAHGRAFGYYQNDIPDDDDAERSFQSLRRAPDYMPGLDLAVLDPDGEIASFAGFWYDDLNEIGIIEPVGTTPQYRKMGLGKAAIYEGINRIRAKGAKRVFVGSEQQFYLSIGFSISYYKEIWEKRL